MEIIDSKKYKIITKSKTYKMDNSIHKSELHSMNDSESVPSSTYRSPTYKRGKKPKKHLKVEKIGENEEYDQSLLKRRK